MSNSPSLPPTPGPTHPRSTPSPPLPLQVEMAEFVLNHPKVTPQKQKLLDYGDYQP